MAEWQWEMATAGAVAGFTTVVALHPLDIVRTRFQGDDVFDSQQGFVLLLCCQNMNMHADLLPVLE